MEDHNKKGRGILDWVVGIFAGVIIFFIVGAGIFIMTLYSKISDFIFSNRKKNPLIA
jgi:hypothetical protein